MTVTGQILINNALTALNILDPGGAPSNSETVDLLGELNTIVDGWSTDSTLIPSVATAQFALTANQNPYPMGPAAAAPFNVARPVRVDRAALILTVGSGTTRHPLDIVGSTVYFAHGDLKSAATTADELYIDYAEVAGILQLYFFPVPSCPTNSFVEMQTWNAIAPFTLGGSVTLPPGYQDPIQQALAAHCLTRYGALVNATTAQVVAALGATAEKRVRALNVKNRVLDPAILSETPVPQPQQAQAPQARQ